MKAREYLLGTLRRQILGIMVEGQEMRLKRGRWGSVTGDGLVERASRFYPLGRSVA